MDLNYDVTNAQLLNFGISQRIIDLSHQWWMRPGQTDFDFQYAMAIWAAKDNVSLAALSINNPSIRHITFPFGEHAYMGLVRTEI